MATETLPQTSVFPPARARSQQPFLFRRQALLPTPTRLSRSAGVLRRTVSLGLILALAACSTDVLAPPERTGSVGPMTRPAMAGPGAGAEMRQDRLAAYPEASTRVSRDDAALSETSPIPAQGVDIDAMVSGGPVVGLAEEQSREIAEGRSAVPVVDGIGTNGVHALSGPLQSAALQAGPLQSGAGQSMPSSRDVASPGADPDLPPLTPDARAAEARRQAQFLEQERRVARPRSDGPVRPQGRTSGRWLFCRARSIRCRNPRRPAGGCRPPRSPAGSA